MRPTLRLLLSQTKPPPHALIITLFTRANCSLCHAARDVLSKAWEKRHFGYQEVDILQDRGLTGEKGGLARKWAVYEFDVPVIHIQPASVSLSAACLTANNKSQANTLPTGTTMEAVKLKKLMHRFTTEEVLRAMQEVEYEGVRPPNTTRGPGFGDLL